MFVNPLKLGAHCGIALLVVILCPIGDAVSSEPSARSTDFLRDVMPALSKAGCNGGSCHGSFQGRGGFRLSLLGFDPQQDYEALVKEGRQRRIFPSAPGQSLALLKPLGRVPHGGGRRFTETDDTYRALADWIARGAPAPIDPALHVARIVATPHELILQPGEHAVVRVEAHWSDGQVQDASAWAIYEIRDETSAEVTPQGRIEALRPGRTAVTVTYMGQVAAVTVTVPYGPAATDLVFAESNFIDRLVAAEWSKLGLQPVPLADDAEFVRRVFLDVIGTLPTADEVRSFVSSTDPDKRAKLVDSLLERSEYVDYWTTKWSDLLRVHRRYVGDKGLWSFLGWVRQAVRENKPVDEMTRELLTSRGSLFTNGATAFYYVDEKPEELAETVSQLFLGIRLHCARCHHHPYEVWSQEDYFGLANFFTQIELKDNQDGGRFGGARLLRPISKVNRQRRPKMETAPKAFGREFDLSKADDIREPLAAWIASPENPYFARNFVNRYWSYFMGRGLVEPVDDLRATNPASHPELLDALTAEFVSHRFDVKHLIRTICNSQVYQLASEAAPEHDRDGMFYTYHPYRRLPAAVLLDAINAATGTTESFEGLPPGTRAVSLPDPSVRSTFLDAFGRSVRNNPCECAATTAPDLAQALHLVNSTQLDAKISADGGRVARLLKEEAKPAAEIIDDLYYATFCRPATADERTKAQAFIDAAPTRKEGVEDLLWTLVNSTEFVFNH